MMVRVGGLGLLQMGVVETKRGGLYFMDLAVISFILLIQVCNWAKRLMGLESKVYRNKYVWIIQQFTPFIEKAQTADVYIFFDSNIE